MPLALTHPLLTAPYMSPDAASTLLSSRTAAWNWDAPLEPLLRWLRAFLYQTLPGVKYLSPLEMANHITARHQTLQKQLILASPQSLSHHPQRILCTKHKKSPRQRPPRRKSHQSVGTCRPRQCTGSHNFRVQKISQKSGIPYPPFTKEKTQPAFKIA